MLLSANDNNEENESHNNGTKPTTKFTSNVNLREAVFSVVAENENGVPFSHSTGFFLSSSGVGVTNFHVLQGQ